MTETVKSYLLKATKATVGCCLAVMFAMGLELDYAASAGIITLLSLQDTKKETLRTAFQRFTAFSAALLIAFLCFRLLGYTIFALGLYLLLFVLFCNWFGLQSSIAVCSVLVTHFWSEQAMTSALVLNELLLLSIGAGLGILLNLFLPRNIGAIQEAQRQIDGLMRRVLRQMAAAVAGEAEKTMADLPLLNRQLAKARAQADAAVNNALTIDLRYYADYIEMRRKQAAVLQRIQEQIGRLNSVPIQACRISHLLCSIAGTFHEYNNAETLLEATRSAYLSYREDPLPQTRDEFEDRAVLFQILGDIEYFLLLKSSFAEALTEEQKTLFWDEQGDLSPPQKDPLDAKG